MTPRASLLGLVTLLLGSAPTLAGCSGGEAEPGFSSPRGARSSSPEAPSRARPASEPGGPPALEPSGEAPPPGRWYELSLPEGARRVVSAAPDIVDATYELDGEERVMLTVFRPMPQQTDLEAWTTATESLLDGIPLREDDALLGDVPARLGTFPSELRWTFVADGWGGLVKCFADSPHDEVWLHERCDPVVRTLRLRRPLVP
jgi:hypothetical protein